MRTHRLLIIGSGFFTAALALAGLILSESHDSCVLSKSEEIDTETRERRLVNPPRRIARKSLSPIAVPVSPSIAEASEQTNLRHSDLERPSSSTVAGRWLHADGHPRSGEQLWIEPCATQPEEMTRSSTTTRSDGTFSFESLAAGTYQITGYPSGSRRFHWPSGPFTINADSIVDLGVATDSSSLSIVGQVRTESLNQVATFPLMVSIRSEDGGRPLTSETDADGRFRFDDLRALSYAADVASPGYRSTSPVLIHAGAQDAEIIIARACGVIEITVVDERGLPFEDGLAEVLDQPGVLEQPRSAGPIRSGNYLSRPLPPGRYQIRLTATGRAPWIESRIVATEGVHIRAVLMPAPFLRRRLCEQDGEGIADAEVVLTRLDPHRFRGDLRCEQRHAAARTDSEGHFKIPIDRDDLILTFLRDGRPRWRGTLNDLWKIESGLDIHLPPAGQIRGQVSDASGRPVAGAGVRADPGGWTRTFGAPVVYTATDGRFLVECITPGRSNLSVLDRQGKVLKDTSAVARIDGAELAHIRLDFTSSDASGPIIVASENP